MAAVSVKWEGGTELLKALQQLPLRVGKRFQREALVHAAEPMARAMSRYAPRGNPHPPNLKDEILIRNSRGKDAQETAIAVGPSTRAFYGGLQELGTAHHPAQPFARPAFDEKSGEALRRFADDVWASLASRKIFRPTAIGEAVSESTGGGAGGSFRAGSTQ